MLSWYCAVPASAGNTGERQGKVRQGKAAPGAQPKRAGERQDGEPGEGMDGWDGMGAIDMEKSGLN